MRDIQRVITVSSWFLSKESLIFSRMDHKKIENLDDKYQQTLDPLYRAFVLALSVCYHAALYSLDTRKEYRKMLADSFKSDSDMETESNDPSNDWVLCEILKCQNVFLTEINLANKNIACNLALLENVFMMIVCIELRIPLFIVGKPGSSKSLAKSIVTNAMQGRNSESQLFQHFKEPYFINFQCSPLTTSEMIVKAFEEAAKFQESVDLNEKVSVVNLDEIGLAEGSESMPLKALHPLLEEGTDSDEKASHHQKVGVIGISNWALDPAKMNRGIFVSRGEPDINELIESAKGICKYDKSTYACIEPYIGDIAKAYLELCDMAKKFKREFFGLRDYYSLIKMINFFCSKDRTFTWSKLEHSVKRNFNGLEIEILEPFRKYLSSKLDNRILDTDPKCGSIDLLESALNSEYASESTSRYLLFLTENNTAIDIIQNYLINVVKIPTHSLTVIFGSSFRSDQQYTEVCRNISLIKHSMEIGKTIILLNSYNLYESLYDALNQYYYEFGGQKFVDLGLGTHRVKCRVHENFRLIVIAEKAAVYDSKRFPIPLINRLEKHFLNASTMLNARQLELVNEIEKWIKIFSERLQFNNGFYKPEPNETFIGYHTDTVATLVLYLTEQLDNLLSQQQLELDQSMEHNDESLLVKQQGSQVITLAKKFLLRCATPDSIIRISSSKEFKNTTEKDFIWNEYFVSQKHLSLKELLSYHTKSKIKLNRMTSTQDEKIGSILSSKLEFNSSNNLIQVSTHSKSSVLNLANSKFQLPNEIQKINIECCVLQSFDTQQQFYSRVRNFFDRKVSSKNEKNFLLIQADLNLKYSSDLIACSRHTIVESFKEALEKSSNGKTALMDNFYIVLIINIPKENVRNFIGFQLGYWSCYHLDELEEPLSDLPPFESLKSRPISRLLREALEESINDKDSDTSMEIADENKTEDIKKTIDLGLLLKKIAHSACSLIVDTNLTRTISRIEIFTRLCDNKTFVNTIINRLVTLQEAKEEYMPPESKNNWLIKDAANFKTINEYSTLRRACQNYFESRLSPLLGYLLSYVDSYSNLNVISDSIENKIRWKLKLWINLLSDMDLCKFDYESMRSKGEDSIELRQFMCQSDWIVKNFRVVHDDSKRLNPSLPFFWLLINQLSDLYSNFITSNRFSAINNSENSFDLNLYAKVISNFFEETQLYKLINQIISQSVSKKKEFSEEILDLYIGDFLLMKCPVNSKDDLFIIKKIIKTLLCKLDEKYKIDIKYSLPMVHYVFETVKNKFDIYLRFTQFESKINESELFKNKNYYSLDSPSNCLYIHLDSCIECIENFKRNFKDNSWVDGQSLNKLYALLQLISQLSLESSNNTDQISNNKFNQINEKFESLTILQLFMDNIPKYDFEKIQPEQRNLIITLFGKLINRLNLNYFYKDINFKNQKTLLNVHNFIVECHNVFNTEAQKKLSNLPYGSNIEDSLNNFYVDIVECLCFRNNQRPNDDTIDSILKVITEKEMKSTENKIFPMNSISRSLLVQIVFKNYNEIVIKHLKNWFINNSLVVGLFESSQEIALLFQNCVYDQYIHMASNLPIDRQLEFANKVMSELISPPNATNKEGFKQIINKIFNEKRVMLKSFEVNYLLILSKIKFVLSILSKLSYEENAFRSIEDKKLFHAFNTNLKEIVLYLKPTSNKLINFIIKDMIRKYGSSSLKYVQSNTEINWMTPPDIIGDDKNIIDKYVLGGDKYDKCKQAILFCIREKNLTFLDKVLERNSIDLFPYLCLAFYQNITILNINIDTNASNIAEMFQPILVKFYKNEEKILSPLLSNSFEHCLKVSPKNLPSMDLSLLLVQLKFFIIYSNSNTIKPLRDLILKPQVFNNKYFPTMPQDDLYDVQLALTGKEVTMWYACPNGHQYGIGNCGKAMVLSNCNECGLRIGGENHQIDSKNKLLNKSLVDKTLTGYCLRDAANEPEMPTSDLRKLNSSAFHLERFIINACMYLACDKENQNDVYNLMYLKPNKNVELKDFFWDHIKKDLKLAGKSLNLNLDELIILLHKLAFSFIEIHDNTAIHFFTAKDDRQNWEKAFNETFLVPLLTKFTHNINESNKIIREKNSNESTQSKVYFMAYELLNEDQNTKYLLYENEEFWRYRPIVTFDLMRIELGLTTSKEQFKVLKQFSQSFYKLQLLENYPDIIKLVKVLHSLFNKAIFKQNAQNKTIKEFITQNMPKDWTKKRVELSVNAMQNVWQYSKQHLNDHIRTFKENTSTLPDFFSHEFNLDTKLSYFLPTLFGDGLYCYALVHYLSSIQNDLLDYYHQIKKVKIFETKNTELFENRDYLIITNMANDLSRIVQANFSYDSKNLKCIFKYDNIESQVIDKYLRTKPNIELNVRSLIYF